MLHKNMHHFLITNLNTKFIQKISSRFGVKIILHTCLAAFWAVILIGTFKSFI